MSRCTSGPTAGRKAVGGDDDARIQVLIVAAEDELRTIVQCLLAAAPPGIKIDVSWAAAAGAAGEPGQARAPRAAESHVRRLPVKQGPSVTLYLKVERIEWIEAANQYVRLHIGRHGHLLRQSMARLESWLDPLQFVRIHRSVIVNLDYVDEVRRDSTARRSVVLGGGRSLEVSARHWDQLHAALLGRP
jgi:hypothetical protein